MLIGNQYADNKLYRGIKHYNSLPLTSGDLHEFSDTLYQKYAFLFNNILGSGTLNAPKCTISNTSGISLNEPIVALLDGDIVLIHSSSPIVSTSDIESSGFSSGLVCAVGWYQSLNGTSVLREYGGVNNNIIENDIVDYTLAVQVSTRYQLRWDTVILDNSTYDKYQSLTFSLKNRDEAGNLTSGSTSITTTPYSGEVHKANNPSSMTYASSELYIIPLLEYQYEGNSIVSAKTHQSIKGVAGDGEYNLSSEVIINDTVDTPTDIDINVGISNFEENKLKVLYNGIPLEKGIHYILNYSNKRVTLLQFTAYSGDVITFIA